MEKGKGKAEERGMAGKRWQGEGEGGMAKVRGNYWRRGGDIVGGMAEMRGMAHGRGDEGERRKYQRNGERR